MPTQTYITAEDNALLGHKPMKDRLMLLFCASASGDLKIKPLLVYHSETPRAFKKCKVQKSRLNVMWRSNNKAWVTRDLFTDWINEVFGPSVKKYLLEMNLPLHVLLVMDKALPILQTYKMTSLKNLNSSRSSFCLPTPLRYSSLWTSRLRISNSKKLYTNALFERCFQVTEGTNLTLREFWKYHFHIIACLKMIEKAWEGVTKRTLTSAWKKLWPESVVECDFEGSEIVPVELVVNEIGLWPRSWGWRWITMISMSLWNSTIKS
ncbi:hypothetical protein B7P43_G04399 [Cryptotermes secundus]|uniref:DDE-1 domain-containing protein n=1 Tax=Cryptotermes secundus TaxID=105785 RepID=A0A2J7PZY8_9NEOP|nr:hypothetical protein B7P43_G04399 [Cryptotermes secundus]